MSYNRMIMWEKPSKWSHGWFELLVYTISDTSQVTTPVQSLQSLIANCFWFQMSGRHFLERWHTVDDSLSHYFRILGWLLTQGLGLQSNAALAGQMHEVVRPVGLVFGWCKNRIGCKDTQKAMNQKKQFKGTLVPNFFSGNTPWKPLIMEKLWLPFFATMWTSTSLASIRLVQIIAQGTEHLGEKLCDEV